MVAFAVVVALAVAAAAVAEATTVAATVEAVSAAVVVRTQKYQSSESTTTKALNPKHVPREANASC